MRKALNRANKEVASRFYQLLSGHAAVADHLKRVGQADSDECFWCGTGEEQTRYHLFVRCRRWAPEIRKMWNRIQAVSGGRGGATLVRRMFGDERNVEAILEFLEKTRVGKMPSRVLLAGPGFGRGGYGGFLTSSVGGRRWGDRGHFKRREGWAGPSPLECTFSFVSLWCAFIIGWTKGKRRSGIPRYDCASWFGVGLWIYSEKPAVAP